MKKNIREVSLWLSEWTMIIALSLLSLLFFIAQFLLLYFRFINLAYYNKYFLTLIVILVLLFYSNNNIFGSSKLKNKQ